MARKKQKESGGGGSPAWMATFSDLMNLLLCFFVLLFAFSSVDAEKFAEIAASLNKSFSVLSGGSSAIGEGKLISQGVSQLDYMSEYYSEMGIEAGNDSETGQGEGENKDNMSDAESDKNTFEEYKQMVESKQKDLMENLYEEVTEAAEREKIEDTVEVALDEDYQYVQISLSGAILFDSGKADLRNEAEPVLDKLGAILKTYDKYLIKIEGHTDNVPIRNSQFQSNMWLSTARATRVFEYLTKNGGLDPKTLEASGRGEYEPVAGNDSEEGRSKNRRVEVKIYNNSSQ